MGEKLQDLRPREAKPFTRLKFMAKWEIRFQRFAISFQPSGNALVFGLSREVKPFTRANEKFHLFPTSQHAFRTFPA